MNLPNWLKPALVGAGCGAVAVAILGFGVGGWVTSSKAAVMAAEKASAEKVAALVPYCLAGAKADPNSADVLAELKNASRYSRDDIVIEAGWATQPGDAGVNSSVARACADQLVAEM